MDTMTRKCESRLEGFTGCTGEPMERVVSCSACMEEYTRRSHALDMRRKQDNADLMALLDNFASKEWADKPKVRVTFSNFFTHATEGKVRESDGTYLLMKQRNSLKGFIITRYPFLGDAVKVEVLDNKGQVAQVWQASSSVSTYSLEAKELADKAGN